MTYRRRDSFVTSGTRCDATRAVITRRYIQSAKLGATFRALHSALPSARPALAIDFEQALLDIAPTKTKLERRIPIYISCSTDVSSYCHPGARSAFVDRKVTLSPFVPRGN